MSRSKPLFSKPICWLTFVLFLWPGVGAGFNLFDPKRGIPPPSAPQQESTPTPPAPPPPPPPAPPKQYPPQQNFQLFGTSRIGNQYSAILQAPNGKQIKVRWQAGEETPINGYHGFKVRNVTYRQIELLYPEDNPCRDNMVQKGVVCLEEGKAARLEMNRAKPTAPQVPPAIPVQANQNPQANEVPPLTPEQQREKEQKEQQWRDRYKTFQPPQNIRAEDVPPGMRVVRTPFGDRLVPVR